MSHYKICLCRSWSSIWLNHEHLSRGGGWCRMAILRCHSEHWMLLSFGASNRSLAWIQVQAWCSWHLDRDANWLSKPDHRASLYYLSSKLAKGGTVCIIFFHYLTTLAFLGSNIRKSLCKMMCRLCRPRYAWEHGAGNRNLQRNLQRLHQNPMEQADRIHNIHLLIL